MTRQLLIEIGFIRCQQVHDAAVVPDLVVQKQFYLFHERAAEIVVEPGEFGTVGIEQPDVTNLQPRGKEILDQ